jgi:ribosome production factor 1
MMVFHNVAYYPRRNMKLEEVYSHGKTLGFTHVMVLRFSQGWELLVRHLQGMLAVFKISSVEFQKQIKHHAVATEHVPELILNNFDSKVGVKVGRLLASLFPQQP